MPKPWLFQEKLISALSDEALIKQFEATMGREEMNQKAFRKALDVLRKRLASRDVSAYMLLRIVASLSKITAGLHKLGLDRSQ